MKKEKVHITNQQTGESKTIEVDVFTDVKEASTKLGDSGLLEAVNDALISRARAKEHRVGQLATAQKRRAVQKAAMEFAKKAGFNPDKIA